MIYLSLPFLIKVDIFRAMKIQVVAFWVVGIMAFRNAGTLPHHYTVS